MAVENFYQDLKAFKHSITEVFNHPDYFADVPDGWSIVISDIKNSTAAVGSGKGNDVNMVAAGSLVAALNIARKHKVEIPFFFGGDGISVIVPDKLLHDITSALLLHKENSVRNFGLEMHIGSIPVSEIISTGHYIKIAKIKVSSSYFKPIMIGSGFKYAEKKIKQSYQQDVRIEDIDKLDLNGLECRWNKIRPPEESNEIVCYLIEATDPSRQLQVYHEVLTKIDEIYGNTETRNPISRQRLKLNFTFQKLKREMILKFGRWKVFYFLIVFIETLLGKFYFKYFKGGMQYVDQLIAFADTLTIEGRINTVISGVAQKRIQLVTYLEEQEKGGDLVFGYHISTQCVMTCFVENRKSKHIHFVDGDEGGYTKAAKFLKMKLSGKVN